MEPPAPPPSTLRWDPKRAAKGLKTSKGDTLATVTGSSDGWHSVLTCEALSGGSHYVEFDVVAAAETANTWKMVLGAVPVAFDCRAPAYTCVGSQQGGWGYVGGSGNRYRKADGPDIPYGQPFTGGDTVGMLLNFAAGTVTFFKNRACFGPAFANVAGPLYVAAALTGKGTKVAVRYVGALPPFQYSEDFVRYPGADERPEEDRVAGLEKHFAFKLAGGKLDLSAPEWSDPLAELAAMGFASLDCAEALLVVLPNGPRSVAGNEESRKKGTQMALEYLLSAPEQRKPRYEVAANTILRYAPQMVTVNGRPLVGGLADEVVRLGRLLEDEQKMREAERASATFDLYKAVLSAIAARGVVTKEDEKFLEALRKQRGVTSSNHKQLTRELGLAKERWKAMTKAGRDNEEALRKLERARQKARDGKGGAAAEVGEDRECIVCLENPRDTVILNCGHFVLCEPCSAEYRKDGAECPTCRREVQECRKVYW